MTVSEQEKQQAELAQAAAAVESNGDYNAADIVTKSEGGAVVAEPDHGMSSTQICSMAFGTIFIVLAGRLGNHWALKEGEADLLGEAAGAVLDKYSPNFAAGPEVGLALVASGVLLPKYAEHMMLQEKAEKEVKQEPKRPIGQKDSQKELKADDSGLNFSMDQGG